MGSYREVEFSTVKVGDKFALTNAYPYNTLFQKVEIRVDGETYYGYISNMFRTVYEVKPNESVWIEQKGIPFEQLEVLDKFHFEESPEKGEYTVTMIYLYPKENGYQEKQLKGYTTKEGKTYVPIEDNLVIKH